MFTFGSIGRSTLVLMTLITIAGCGGSSVSLETQSEAAPPVVKRTATIASAAELAKVIDLTKVAVPPGAEFNARTPSQLEVIAPLSLQQAFDFYLTNLAKIGLQISKEPNSKQVYEGSASAALEKDGHSAYLSVFEAGEKGKVMISVGRQGNLDLKSLPRSPGAKPLYDGPSTSMYVAAGSVADERKFVDAALRKAGWQPFGRPHTASAENPDQWIAEYRNRGYALSIMINLAPAQGNKTAVQYGLSTISHELPAPTNAADVEFNDNDWVMTCRIPSDIDTAEKYYLTTMPTAGYKTLSPNEPNAKRRILRFETGDKGILLVELDSDADDAKQTTVKCLHFSAELLAKMNEPKPEPTTTPEPKPTPKSAGIFARSLPFPPEAKQLSYDVDGEQIKFQATGAIAPLVKALRAKFTAAGWKEQPGVTTVDANAGAMLLERDGTTLTFVLINLGLGGGTEAIVSTQGLDWKTAESE